MMSPCYMILEQRVTTASLIGSLTECLFSKAASSIWAGPFMRLTEVVASGSRLVVRTQSSPLLFFLFQHPELEKEEADKEFPFSSISPSFPIQALCGVEPGTSPVITKPAVSGTKSLGPALGTTKQKSDNLNLTDTAMQREVPSFSSFKRYV